MRRKKNQTTMTILGYHREIITSPMNKKSFIGDQPPLATRIDQYKLQYFGHVSKISGKETTLKKNYHSRYL